MGRPPFQPTEEQRRTVSIAAGGGMSHEVIAISLGIDRKTLEKHFEAELSTVAYQRRVEVIEAMHMSALKGNVSAQRAYLQLEPALAVPPDGAEGKPKPVGKKEQADADAKTAAANSAWRDLLPNQTGVKTLQ
jgi:hypothetical protein